MFTIKKESNIDLQTFRPKTAFWYRVIELSESPNFDNFASISLEVRNLS